jgi:hypothetical protein
VRESCTSKEITDTETLLQTLPYLMVTKVGRGGERMDTGTLEGKVARTERSPIPKPYLKPSPKPVFTKVGRGGEKRDTGILERGIRTYREITDTETLHKNLPKTSIY